MLPFAFRAGCLTALLFCCAPGCRTEVANEEESDAARQKKQEKELEKRLCAILREDGCLRYPKCPWEIYVKRVVGDKLMNVVVKCRDKTGKNHDMVVWAHVAELHIDMRNRQLLVHMRHALAPQGFIEDKVLPIDISGLPAQLLKK